MKLPNKLAGCFPVGVINCALVKLHPHIHWWTLVFVLSTPWKHVLSACMGLHSWGVPPYMAVARSVCVFKAENFLLGESPLFCDGLVEPERA